jgi:hypothetical protein
MSDLKPFKHGEEGTHGCCPEILEKMGGKATCCECSSHKCSQSTPKEDFNRVMWEYFDETKITSKLHQQIVDWTNFVLSYQKQELLNRVEDRFVGGLPDHHKIVFIISEFRNALEALKEEK